MLSLLLLLRGREHSNLATSHLLYAATAGSLSGTLVRMLSEPGSAQPEQPASLSTTASLTSQPERAAAFQQERAAASLLTHPASHNDLVQLSAYDRSSSGGGMYRHSGGNITGGNGGGMRGSEGGLQQYSSRGGANGGCGSTAPSPNSRALLRARAMALGLPGMTVAIPEMTVGLPGSWVVGAQSLPSSPHPVLSTSPHGLHGLHGPHGHSATSLHRMLSGGGMELDSRSGAGQS